MLMHRFLLGIHSMHLLQVAAQAAPQAVQVAPQGMQAVPQLTPPPSHFDIPEILSASANYLAQMQATINTLAVIVTVVTIIVGLIGIVFTTAGFLAQRRAQQEIKQFHDESTKEMADRHQMHKDEIKLLNEARDARDASMLASIRQELNSMMDEKFENIDRVYSAELIQRIHDREISYASSLRQIEDILMTFQEELSTTGAPQYAHVAEFVRYNTFRNLLTRLVAGGRQDRHSALSRILAEYVEDIGQSTASLLRSLVLDISKSGRITGSDQRILIERLINALDIRFPQTGEEDRPEPT